MRSSLVTLALAFALSACGSETDAPVTSGADVAADASAAVDGGADGEATVDAGPAKPEVAWGACSGTYQGIQPQCATVQLPFAWKVEGGETLGIHVARVQAKQPRRGSLWLLQGGPGGDGSSLAQLAAQFAERVPDLDIYLPDHRGTGLSGRLGCEAQEAQSSMGGAGITTFEWNACLKSVKEQWGDNLNLFTTTGAAHDIHNLIEATREPNDQVYIYGVSYGTYWAHRFLQIFPDAVDGVVLDSVCPPGECVGDQYDTAFNNVGKVFMDLCGKDVVCGSKLGKDPWKFLGDLFAKADTGKHCTEFFTKLPPIQLKMLFSQLLKQFQLRSVIPAIAYRLNRCDQGDLKVLNQFLMLAQFLGAGGFMPEGGQPGWATNPFSQFLNAHILMSEMWSDPAPSPQEVQKTFIDAYIAPGASFSTINLFNVWPKYSRDEYVNKFASTDTPLLLLNGTLDPQTPDYYAEAMYKGLDASDKELVIMAGAAHGTVSQAPTVTNQMCGMELSVQFVKDPKKDLDKSCVNLMAPVAFNLPAFIVKQFLGVNDLYENDAKTDALAAPVPFSATPWTPVPSLPRWN